MNNEQQKKNLETFADKYFGWMDAKEQELKSWYTGAGEVWNTGGDCLCIYIEGPKEGKYAGWSALIGTECSLPESAEEKIMATIREPEEDLEVAMIEGLTTAEAEAAIAAFWQGNHAGWRKGYDWYGEF